MRRKPVYDGFKKAGESLTCASCGHKYESEDEVPFKKKKKASVFTEDDAPKKVSIFTDEDVSEVVNVFGDDEIRRNCRYCAHYVVNPFTQRCGLHMKEVQATDVCSDFEENKQEDDSCSDAEGHGLTRTDTFLTKN